MPSNFLQDLISSLLERSPRFGSVDDTRSMETLCAALTKATGENSINRLGATILEKYQSLDENEKLDFFSMLAENFDVDPDEVSQLAQVYKSEMTAANLDALLNGCEPARQDLLRRLNHVPDATRALVAMRSDLLKLSDKNEALKRVDLDFAHLFASWFNRGLLVEERVTWDSSASVLAKIIKYEAVHAINDWEDLRRRIQPPDRRCFAFFHPAMPNEPLVFVEVALCKGTPSSIQDLLKTGREPMPAEEADSAVFYSISNCQTGLRGISFGNSLIKKVATDLARELPQLTNFVTLSPLPGFANWVQNDCALMTDENHERLAAAQEALLSSADVTKIEEWREPLKTLAAHYLYKAKRSDGTPIDSVARFHLNNGASIQDIHAMADISRNGLERSFGVMVNYHYDLKEVESFHEDFATNAKVHASKLVRQRADTPPKIAMTDNTILQ